MTLLDDLTAYICRLEGQAARIPELQKELDQANAATREARRRLAAFQEGVTRISTRDLDTLRHIASGRTFAEAAQQAGLTQDAVKARMRRIYRFYGVAGPSAAVMAALRYGDLNPDTIDGTWYGGEPSPAQLRVMQACATHGTHEAAAKALKMSKNTVAVHLNRVSKQAGTGAKVQILVRAFKKGWIE